VNHKGAAFVVVSCVTKDPPYRPHPHNLVGKMKELSQGICYFKTVSNQSVVVFPHLGIQCVKKKDIDKSLTERERLKVDPFKSELFSH
jgi:c-Rel proto-oncogene protein